MAQPEPDISAGDYRSLCDMAQKLLEYKEKLTRYKACGMDCDALEQWHAELSEMCQVRKQELTR